MSNLIHYLCVVSKVEWHARPVLHWIALRAYLHANVAGLGLENIVRSGIPRRVSADWHKTRARGVSWANPLTLVMFRTFASERLGMTAKVTRNGRSFIRIPSRVLDAARKWQKLVVREGSEIEARSSSCRFVGEELCGIQMFFFRVVCSREHCKKKPEKNGRIFVKEPPSLREKLTVTHEVVSSTSNVSCPLF